MLLERQALSGQPDGALGVRPEEGPASSPQTLPPTTTSVAVGTGSAMFSILGTKTKPLTYSLTLNPLLVLLNPLLNSPLTSTRPLTLSLSMFVFRGQSVLGFQPPPKRPDQRGPAFLSSKVSRLA